MKLLLYFSSMMMKKLVGYKYSPLFAIWFSLFRLPIEVIMYILYIMYSSELKF